MAEIQHTGRKRAADISGMRKAKLVYRARMSEKAIVLANLLVAYANQAEQFDLAADMTLTRTVLANQRHTVVVETVERVLQNATRLLEDLAGYGVSQADLDELTTLIATYRGFLVAPREAVNQRRQDIHELGALFAQADALLREQLDRLMIAKRGSGAYAAYRSARKPVGSGRTAKPVATLPEAGGPGSVLSLRA